MGNCLPNRQSSNRVKQPEIEMSILTIKQSEKQLNNQIENNDYWLLHMIRDKKQLQFMTGGFEPLCCNIIFFEPRIKKTLISINCLKKILELECFIFVSDEDPNQILSFTTPNNTVLLTNYLAYRIPFFLAKQIIFQHTLADDEVKIDETLLCIGNILHSGLHDKIQLSIRIRSFVNNSEQARYVYRLYFMTIIKKCFAVELDGLLFKHIHDCQEKYPYTDPRCLAYYGRYFLNIIFSKDINPDYKETIKKLSICSNGNFDILDQVQ